MNDLGKMVCLQDNGLFWSGGNMQKLNAANFKNARNLCCKPVNCYPRSPPVVTLSALVRTIGGGAADC